MKELICYLDINEVEYKNELIKISENINKQIKLLIYTKKWMILKYYQDFLNEKIKAEEFFMIWDISSSIKLNSKTLILEILFEIYQDIISNNTKKYRKSIIIVDKKSKTYFENKFVDKIDFIILNLKNLDSKLFFI